MTRAERTDRDRKPAPFVDSAFSDPMFIESWRQRLLSRRRFMLDAMAAGAGLYAFNAFAGDAPGTAVDSLDKAGKAGTARAAADTGWDRHARRTLAAVQNQLFPAGDGASAGSGPGAHDINALAYLLSALEDPALAEDSRFIRNGIGWLDDLSATTNDKNFLQLDVERREQLLGKIATSSAGENWLSMLLLYIFEALLTDPVYGGNPDGIGWRWLEHAPGFPRPPADKTYRNIG